MTTELEQEFYDTFGIEPKWKCSSPLLKIYNSDVCKGIDNCNKCAYYEYYYPEIISYKLLQMICIINEFISMFNWKQIKYISTFEIETLKENILKDLIWILSNECNDVTKKQLKQQIQQLFKD